MAGSLNKVILVGNLGNDPDVRTTQSGDKVTRISVATSERWRNKDGENQERTEWHRVVIFGKVAEIAEKYLRKGAKVLIEGQLRTNKWQDNNGVDKYSTEIIVSGFGGNMTMLDNRNSGGGGGGGGYDSGGGGGGSYDSGGGGGGSSNSGLGAGGGHDDGFEDDVPF